MPSETGTRNNLNSNLAGSNRLPVLRKVALLVAGSLLSLLLIESICRVRERVVMHDAVRRRAVPVADSELGQRMPPNSPDHDARGFRNRSASASAEIVAIGDSQTWGVNVQQENAWPQDLERISHHSVYNMAVGGYGPVQYLVLSEEAFELSPKVVIVAVYLGNDLFDAYSLAYKNDRYTDLRSPQSADLAEDTLSQRVDELYKEILAADSIRGHMSFLVSHSAILRFLMIPASEYWYASAWARSHPDRYAVYDKGGVKTVLTTGYRLSAVDLDEPRILEGLKITERSLAKIHESMNNHSVKLLVVIIPTKEAVFAPSAGSNLDPTYEKLLHMEGRARQQLVDFCASNGIEAFDPLPILSQAVASGAQIYPEDTDGHPNAAGYGVLATTMYNRLRTLHWIN
jgi:lysophospholipase L1-like esterase